MVRVTSDTFPNDVHAMCFKTTDWVIWEAAARCTQIPCPARTRRTVGSQRLG